MKTFELEKMSLLESHPSEIGNKVEQSAYCVEYLNQPFYRNLKEMVKVQISSCERLLVNTKGINERNVIQKEILMLKLALELLEY